MTGSGSKLCDAKQMSSDVDPSTLLELAKGASGFIRAIGRVIARWARRPIAFFLSSSAGVWPGKKAAERYAFATLGGSIVTATPYRDLGNSHLRIAVIRKEFDKSHDSVVYLLEYFAGSFRIAWQSKRLFSIPPVTKLVVLDLDGDGKHEISFAEASFGTGGGSETVWLYIPQRDKLASATWSHDWQNWNSSPHPKLQMKESDPILARMLEKVAPKLRVRKLPSVPNLDDPLYAVVRWHKENGPLTAGEISVYEYEGKPAFENSILDEANDGDSIYTAYFKGSVTCYDIRRNTHFVVWSPGWIYHWPQALLVTPKFLFIQTRGQGIIRFDKSRRRLDQIAEFKGQRFYEVDSLCRSGQFFKINESFLIPSDLIENEDWKKLIPFRANTPGGNDKRNTK
jgi:hypothetical protein